SATREEVQHNIAFPVRFSERHLPCRSPTAHQLEVLRRDIDPHSLRDLELYSGDDRLSRIESLAIQEPAHERLYATLQKLHDRCGSMGSDSIDPNQSGS